MFHKENSSIVSSKGGKKGKDVALRKSDRRHLRLKAAELFSNCSEEDNQLLDTAFLEGTLSARTLLHSTQKVTLYYRSPDWIYRHASQCIWMYLEAEEVHVPTVALLALLSLPEATVLVPPQVSKYLCRGADLMRAGMRSLPTASSSSMGERPASVVAVCIQGNPQAFAVGILSPEITSQSDIGVGTTGVGVRIVTCYGDDLWRQQLPSAVAARELDSFLDQGHYGNAGFLQGKGVVPIDEGEAELESDHEVEEEQLGDETVGVHSIIECGVGATNKNDLGSSRNDLEADHPDNKRCDKEQQQQQVEEAGEGAHLNDGKETNDHQQEGEKGLSPDEVLHEATCKALALINPKTQLPMTLANFYSQHVVPNRPDGTVIQIKLTKYKKFGVYVAQQVEGGLIQVGPDKNKKDAMAMLIGYDRRNPNVRKYAAESKTADNKSYEQTRLVLVDLFCIPHHFQSLLHLDKEAIKAENATSEERRGTGMLTLKEVRAVLDDYINKENLATANKNTVTLNGPLTEVLYKSLDSPPLEVSRKVLASTWQSRMEQAYALVQMPGSRIIKLGRGPPPTVLIEVSKRMSKKFVTRVRGLEDYMIRASEFCKDVSHRFACSGAIEDNPEGRAALRKGHVELVFQGNLVDELEALLLGDPTLTSHGGAKDSPYQLPKSAIQVVLRKGVPARKRRG